MFLDRMGHCLVSGSARQTDSYGAAVPEFILSAAREVIHNGALRTNEVRS